MADRLRVLFVHISPNHPSFIQSDLDILSRHFDVRGVFYGSRRSIWAVAKGTLWADVTFSWFAWDQAAWATRFSRILGRKSIVVIGGFDVVRMPEIPYGNLLSRNSTRRTRYAINHADRVTAISQSLKADAERLTGRKDIEVIYLGFDANQFRPSGSKERVALTVGALNRSNLQRKGLDAFIKAAAYAPDIEFRLVGKVEPEMRRDITDHSSKNLHILGEVDFGRLLSEMQVASAYVQPSAHEGFGCSLAEAMLCECVPVISDRGAIPEVVGDTGIYVPPGNPREVAKGIEMAMDSPQLGIRARERIARLFPLENRQKRLVEIVTEAISA
jgi:glycosyltransferase involved in cell wall biosynthesis